jgi:hypothetical protein
MSRRESAFETSLLPADKMMAAGAVVTAICVPLRLGGLSGGQWLFIIIGGCGAIAGPMVLLVPLFTKRGGYGDCPVCQTKIEAMTGDARDLLCGGCGAYLDVDGEHLATIEPGRTNPTPLFAVPTPWPDVRNVLSSTIAFSASDYVTDAVWDALAKKSGTRVMDAHWPPGCCVCSRPATRKDQLSLNIKMAGAARDTLATLVVRDIPYCAEHKSGIDFGDATFDSRGHERAYVLRFRSHAYREAFRALNPWQWQGMVTAREPVPAQAAAPEEKVIVRCPHCQQLLRVPAGKRGTITCRCGGSFTVST